MSQYIKLEGAIDALVEREEIIDGAYSACAALRTLPTIEIVRCADCKYWTLELDKFQKDDGSIHFCELTEALTNAGDYCSYGERIEE